MSAALVRPPGETESSIPRRGDTQCSSRFMSSVAWSVHSANGKALRYILSADKCLHVMQPGPWLASAARPLASGRRTHSAPGVPIAETQESSQPSVATGCGSSRYTQSSKAEARSEAQKPRMSAIRACVWQGSRVRASILIARAWALTAHPDSIDPRLPSLPLSTPPHI